VEVYKLRNSVDHPESIEPFGLLRADDSPRPAFAAFKVATALLGGFLSAQREQQGDVVAVTFDRGDRATTVVWTQGPSPRRVRVKAIASEALLVDPQGTERPVKAINGTYTIDLPGAACSPGNGCFIGGAPRLVVEQGRTNGRQALMASPSTSSLRRMPPKFWPAWKSRLLEE
jgi:hypothetical protein